MQHLDEERTEPTNQHWWEIGVHDARHAVHGEVGLGAIVASWRRIAREPDGISDVAIDSLTKPRWCLSSPFRRQSVLPSFAATLWSLPSFADVVCDTGVMASTQPLRRTTTEGETQTGDAVQTQKPWNVIVWNDPVTPMTVVVVIFRKIFGYSNNKCTQLMLAVHNEGRALVWSGHRERAESYCVKLQVAGLQSTIEQDN